jgi:nucleotidyltransferase substrate binding protein (TIGR01987 family)
MALELDLSSFSDAVDRLAESIAISQSKPADELYRDGMIQRFEYTYEQAHKMLKRYLEMSASSADVIDAMAFQDLIRTGSEQGLLKHDWETWKTYRTARGTTSHAYNEKKAKAVADQIPLFLEEARHLLNSLKQRVKG